MTELCISNTPLLEIPETLKPSLDTIAFPQVTAEDLRELREKGWFHIGVATAILNPDGKILIFEHAESDKNTAGVYGPPCETVKFAPPPILM